MLTAQHHLTRDLRCQIYALNKRGATQLGLAVDIGVNQGTIRGELGLNRGFCGYRFLQAHHFTVQKGLVRKGVARVMTPCLILRAETLLRNKQQSPQQICGALNHEDSTKVSYESLYRRETQRCHSQHGGAEDQAHHSGAAGWTNLRSHKRGHNKTAYTTQETCSHFDFR